MSTSSIFACPSTELRPRKEHGASIEGPFREATGGLMWVVNMTCPDVLNTVRGVARHSHNPPNAHWRVVLQILRHLKGEPARAHVPEGSQDEPHHVGRRRLCYEQGALAVDLRKCNYVLRGDSCVHATDLALHVLVCRRWKLSMLRWVTTCRCYRLIGRY